MEFCEVPSSKCDTPAWLNKHLLENALRIGYEDPQLTVLHHDVSPATAPGDNYVSELYRVTIDLSSNGKQQSVIIKCLPTSEYNLKFIHDARLFEKEISFYNVTLPAMGIANLAPRCVFTREDMLILEDLAPMGFKMVNRRCGLDIVHCRSAIKALARLHANSVSLSPSELAHMYPETIYHDFDHAYRYINHSLTSLGTVVRTWPKYEHFADYIFQLSKTVLDQVLKLMPANPPPEDLHLYVLNHGDYWTNNIMFSYDESNIKEVKVLDFQMCRYTSLALDLQYFLYTSLREQDQTSAEDILLDVYYNEFCRTLKRDDHLTRDQLKAEMKRTEIFGFVNACMMLPVVLADPEEVTPDLGNVAETTSTSSDTLKWHNGSQFKRQFQKILLHFEEKGLFSGIGLT